MNMATAQTILNQIGAVNTAGGYAWDTKPKRKSSEIANNSQSNEAKKNRSKEAYRQALINIGHPATTEELSAASYRSKGAISSFDFKNPGFFKKTTRLKNAHPINLYWIEGLENE